MQIVYLHLIIVSINKCQLSIILLCYHNLKNKHFYYNSFYLCNALKSLFSRFKGIFCWRWSKEGYKPAAPVYGAP